MNILKGQCSCCFHCVYNRGGTEVPYVANISIQREGVALMGFVNFGWHRPSKGSAKKDSLYFSLVKIDQAVIIHAPGQASVH